MPDYRSSGREPRRNYDERPVRSGSTRPAGARPAGSRPSQGSRPAGARPQGSRPSQGSRPAGARPQGSRPSQGNRRPASRRKKRTQPRFFIFIAVIAIVLALALILLLGGGKDKDTTVMPQATPTAAPNMPGMTNATISTGQPGDDANAAVQDAVAPATTYSTLSQWLGDEDAEITALSEDEMVKVQDLSVNTSLPQEWINVLLLGTDERSLSESTRTDTMIICSINTKTGEVKLTSVMRDMAVKLENIGKYSGTYRMNSVNYFGGPYYTMKVLNECFDMNIQYYAAVNFFGFQRIASALGGVDIDITEAEMNEINRGAIDQAKIAFYNGVDDSDLYDENVLLETYGPNTHLNGRQTLAYARIRKIDSDYSRAERQRTVLVKLLDKLKTKSAAEIIMLIGSMQDQVSTNMDWSVVSQIVMTVLNNGLSNVETMRLPVIGTYVEERRNDEAMLYDTDWKANSLELYNFIYA